jgi:Icc protein
MLIAQITDIHLGFEPGNPDELNRQRLDCVLRTLGEMVPRPDLLLATGDLADAGDDTDPTPLKLSLSELPIPGLFRARQP